MKKIEELIKEIDRELGLRQANYPKWIQAKSLHPEQAKKQIDRMTRVREILKGTDLDFEIVPRKTTLPEITPVNQMQLFHDDSN